MDEIVQMCWSNTDLQDSVHYATRAHKIHTYKFTKENEEDTVSDLGVFSTGKGVIRGLEAYSKYNCKDGTVNIWSLDNNQNPIESFSVGENLYSLKQSKTDPSRIATGGKENDLKVWDISRPQSAIFKAKNISDNWVQLREPVWVLCIDYYDENKIAVGTGHKQLRIYDTKGGVRKPVVNLVYSDYPVTALRVCPSNSNHIIVGNTHGDMEMIDMRILKPCKKYKNIHGTIKSIEIMDTCVATCGLDRFLRVYNLDTSDIASKIYLKSRLNCVLYSKHEPIVNRKSKPKTNENDQDDILSDINSEDFGTDQLWSDIETITDEHPEVFKKKKKDQIDGFAFKKPK